jgi:nickel-dependent lactate racemase
MKFTIPYLDRSFPLEIPEENFLALAEPNPFTPGAAPAALLRDALLRPLGPGPLRPSGEGPSLEEFLSGGKKVLLILNDATRPTPTPAMLEALDEVLGGKLGELPGLGFIIATGAHRAPTEDEYRQIFGKFYGPFREKTSAHNARKEDELVSLGTSSRGTPLVFNRKVLEADRIIITGSVEPHYFAGFTGGRKAFLPGTAGRSSIEANHKLSLDPRARALALEGNPVHEDMMDALKGFRIPVFSLMTVLDRDQDIVAASAGDMEASFLQMTQAAGAIFSVKIPRRGDIVVSVAKFPMDIDFYQSQKAIDNGALALRDGGRLILVSSCRTGIGDRGFAELLARAAGPGEALELIDREYRLGYHKAAKLAAVALRARIVAVAELPREELEPLFIEKSPSPQAALEEALEAAKAGGISRPQVVFIPDGCLTVPAIEKG